ncbi:TIGR02186 family protein [Salipiger abyssi]|uniref:TIGR02186 family protein n=1 Tax=Salipiger abyssi TaxID=1250539 RepID=UPI004058B7D7
MRKALALLLALLPAAGNAADAPEATFALSLDEVEITTGFHGAELLVFGAPTGGTAGNYDVVITVTGPPGRATLRRKEQVAGIWMFTREAQFVWMPSFYTVATTGPLDEIVDPVENLRHGIAPGTYIPAPIGLETREETDLYFDAMRRLTSESRRITLEEGIVELSQGVLFQARIPLPVSLVPGTYDVRVFLLEDGVVLSRSDVDLPVRKSSLQRLIYRAAQDYGLLYGIAAALIALFAGWLASAIFSRR